MNSEDVMFVPADLATDHCQSCRAGSPLGASSLHPGSPSLTSEFVVMVVCCWVFNVVWLKEEHDYSSKLKMWLHYFDARMFHIDNCIF